MKKMVQMLVLASLAVLMTACDSVSVNGNGFSITVGMNGGSYAGRQMRQPPQGCGYSQEQPLLMREGQWIDPRRYSDQRYSYQQGPPRRRTPQRYPDWSNQREGNQGGVRLVENTNVNNNNNRIVIIRGGSPQGRPPQGNRPPGNRPRQGNRPPQQGHR